MKISRSCLVALQILLASSVCHAQAFRIGDWWAYALVGPVNLQKGIQYVSFSGDHGLRGWIPDARILTPELRQEELLLSRFQLRIVNLEFPLPGIAGGSQDKAIDDAVLYALTSAGFDVVSRANNHALDLGSEGVEYTARRLTGAGLQRIGLRQSPVFHWETGAARIDICALADSLDRPDPDHLITMIDSDGLTLVKALTRNADFRIAFVHLGSASRFPSPHERSKVETLLDAGFGLVVCTGSHFIKGFQLERGQPVAYGIGDHMLSIAYGGPDAEPLGMHLVAGFSAGRLKQIFVIPFHNDIRAGKTGRLDRESFDRSIHLLQSRSGSGTEKYYSDPAALRAMGESIRTLRLSHLRNLKARHLVYAGRLILQQRPACVGAAALLLVGSVLTVVTIARRLRRAGTRPEP